MDSIVFQTNVIKQLLDLIDARNCDFDRADFEVDQEMSTNFCVRQSQLTAILADEKSRLRALVTRSGLNLKDEIKGLNDKLATTAPKKDRCDLFHRLNTLKEAERYML